MSERTVEFHGGSRESVLLSGSTNLLDAEACVTERSVHVYDKGEGKCRCGQMSRVVSEWETLT